MKRALFSLRLTGSALQKFIISLSLSGYTGIKLKLRSRGALLAMANSIPVSTFL
ncbi:hypothetical protein D3C71_1731340 [compost metagenome]